MPPTNLDAWKPTASDPFDRRKAAHLLRRAGFGAGPEEIARAVEQGLEATVEGLFDEAEDQEKEFARTFDAVSGSLVDFGDHNQARAWWLYRMVRTRTPLREKLAVFWHGHFATSIGKVEDSNLMLRQVETFRRLAWGNVRDLVTAMAKDAAMLIWLDGESSTQEHPNENFARELMELFTCGIGPYTEADVQAAARAFTGWHREGAEFVFEAEAHDAGVKSFLGKSGHFDGGDIIAILIQQPATPRFLARKLLRFFAAPAPAEVVVDEAATLLDRTQLDVKWFLRDLFLSRYFYSNACYRTRISSPIESVVGAVRTLRPRWPAPDLVEHLDRMGQSLLAPPNVKGWDGERAWINSTTWAARLAFASEVARLADGNPLAPNLDVARIVPGDVSEPSQVVNLLAEHLLQGDLPEPARKAIAEALVVGEKGPAPDQFRDDGDFRATRVREALATIVGLPEAQAY